jgi:hypothetical protein
MEVADLEVFVVLFALYLVLSLDIGHYELDYFEQWILLLDEEAPIQLHLDVLFAAAGVKSLGLFLHRLLFNIIVSDRA